MKRYIVLPVDLLQKLKALELPRKQMNKAIKLMGMMLNRANRDSLLMTEYIDLPKNYLREVFGSYKWLKNLKDENILQTNEKYHTGQSKRYRINPDLLLDKFISCSYEEQLHICGTKHLKPFVVADFKGLTINHENLIRITDEYADSIEQSDFRINHQIDNDFFEVIDRKYGTKRMTTLKRAIEVATARGMVVIKDRNKYYIDYFDGFFREKRRAIRFHYKKAIDKLHRGIYYVHRNTTNKRLDTNITNLCEVLTKQIVEDNNLCSLDLSNSQFAIFCHLYQQADNPITLDFIRFKSLATSGGLYEEVAELLGLDSRKQAKSLMFELFFSSHRYQPRHKKKLREHFPTVVSFIDEYKKEHGDNMFSIELQKQEAEIFIDNIYSRIKEEDMFCLTKHDSVIVHRKDRMRAQQIIEEYFDEIGLEGSLKLEQMEPVWVIELRERLDKMSYEQGVLLLSNMAA